MPTTTIDPTVQLGSTGAKVKELQELLNHRRLPASDLMVDGIFGQKVEATVKVVQYQFLLHQDGIAGSLTWRSLRADAPVDKPVLRRGSTGEPGSTAQQVLKDGGYYKGKIEGDFGTQTEAAARCFQQDRHLFIEYTGESQKLVVDGVIADQSWKALSQLATSLSVA